MFYQGHGTIAIAIATIAEAGMLYLYMLWPFSFASVVLQELVSQKYNAVINFVNCPYNWIYVNRMSAELCILLSGDVF